MWIPNLSKELLSKFSLLQVSTFSLAIKAANVGLSPITFLALTVSPNGQIQRLLWWGREREKDEISSFCKFGAVLLCLGLSSDQKLKVWVELLSTGLLELQKRTSSELSWHWGGVCRNQSHRQEKHLWEIHQEQCSCGGSIQGRRNPGCRCSLWEKSKNLCCKVQWHQRQGSAWGSSERFWTIFSTVLRIRQLVGEVSSFHESVGNTTNAGTLFSQRKEELSSPKWS